MTDTRTRRKFRSQEWFDSPDNPGMTTLYLNQECTRGTGGLAGIG